MCRALLLFMRLQLARSVWASLFILALVGFGPHPSFWAHCHPKRSAARPPRPSQLCCFLFDPQKYLQLIAAPGKGFFFPLDHRGYEIWGPAPARQNYFPPPPRPTHRTLLSYTAPLKYKKRSISRRRIAPTRRIRRDKKRRIRRRRISPTRRIRRDKKRRK